jgi:hypothetical protein
MRYCASVAQWINAVSNFDEEFAILTPDSGSTKWRLDSVAHVTGVTNVFYRLLSCRRGKLWAVD